MANLSVESGSADRFEVKEARVQRRWEKSRWPDGDSLTIKAVWQDAHEGVVVNATGADVAPEAPTYRVVVPPHGHWSTLLSVAPTIDGVAPASFVRRAQGELSPSDRRRQDWVAKISSCT